MAHHPTTTTAPGQSVVEGNLSAYCVFLDFAKYRDVSPNGNSTIESCSRRANVRYLHVSITWEDEMWSWLTIQ